VASREHQTGLVAFGVGEGQVAGVLRGDPRPEPAEPIGLGDDVRDQVEVQPVLAGARVGDALQEDPRVGRTADRLAEQTRIVLDVEDAIGSQPGQFGLVAGATS
jgi:hypothetical protein